MPSSPSVAWSPPSITLINGRSKISDGIAGSWLLFSRIIASLASLVI